MSKEAGVGRIFFSYAQDDRKSEREAELRPGKFEAEEKDLVRLLPRLRERPRRLA